MLLGDFTSGFTTKYLYTFLISCVLLVPPVLSCVSFNYCSYLKEAYGIFVIIDCSFFVEEDLT